MAEEITKEKAAEIAQKPEPKFFEFGDVFFECNRCGNYERLDKGVKDGLQFVLPTSDQHEWRMVCGKCKNMMRIFFKESDEETKVEAREKYKELEEKRRKEKEEAALEKAKKEAKNEPKKKNKKEGSSKGNFTNPEWSYEANAEGGASASSTD